MTATEPLPTGPAFSARLHAALGILGVDVATPEDRHGAWLLGLERAADDIQTGTTGLHAWKVAHDVVQWQLGEDDLDPDTRQVITDLEAALADAHVSITTGCVPTIAVTHVAQTTVSLTFALGEAYETRQPVAGHSALAITLALAHISIILVTSETVNLQAATA